MDDISGRGTNHTTQNEALFPDLKEEHEDHPKTAHEDADEAKKKKGRPHTLWQRWRAGTIHNQLTVVFTVLIFLATSAYAIFSGYQLSVMKQQVAEMKSGSTDTHDLAIAAGKQAVAADTQSKQAIEQTNAMGKSLKKTDDLIRATADLAKEARRSADVARDSLNAGSATFRLDQRPWVMPLRFRMSGEPEENKPFTVTIYMTNSGKTAAINATPQSRVLNWHVEPPAVNFAPLEEERSRGIIPPGSTASFFTTDPYSMDAAQLTGYKFGTYKIYVQAKFSYSDIFESPHWTTICIFHEFGKSVEEWNFCSKGNDADHEQIRTR